MDNPETHLPPATAGEPEVVITRRPLAEPRRVSPGEAEALFQERVVEFGGPHASPIVE